MTARDPRYVWVGTIRDRVVACAWECAACGAHSQARALEDAAVHMVLLTANGRLNDEEVPKLIKAKRLTQVLR